MHEVLLLGGFFKSRLSEDPPVTLISLNTNLWYNNNKVIDGSGDPSGQFAWLEDQLISAEESKSKVSISDLT